LKNVKIGKFYAVYWQDTDKWFVGRVSKTNGQLIQMEYIHWTSPDANHFKTG